MALDASAVLNNEFGLSLVIDDTKLRSRLETSMDIVAEKPGKWAETLSSSEYIVRRK